jgi:hypothetical protein
MKNTVILLTLLLLLVPKAYSSTINLDFSTGTYNGSNYIYEEDGFDVAASHGFHSIRLNTLAWYEGDNVITISSDGDLFDLNYLTIVNRAFAGLEFKSSKGGLISVGSIAGLLTFSGEEWDAIDYFTISSITHFDILNQIDNVSLTTVPSPPSALLFFTALFLLWLTKYLTNKSTRATLFYG